MEIRSPAGTSLCSFFFFCEIQMITLAVSGGLFMGFGWVVLRRTRLLWGWVLDGQAIELGPNWSDEGED